MTPLNHDSLFKIFGLRLLLTKVNKGPVLHTIANVNKTFSFFSPRAQNSFFDRSLDNCFKKNAGLLLSNFKHFFFTKNYNISRFSTKKANFLDFRLKPPRTAYFPFNLITSSYIPKGLFRSKAPINFFANFITYQMYLYRIFSRRFGGRALKDFERVKKLNIPPAFFKRFSFLFFNSYFFPKKYSDNFHYFEFLFSFFSRTTKYPLL